MFDKISETINSILFWLIVILLSPFLLLVAIFMYILGDSLEKNFRFLKKKGYKYKNIKRLRYYYNEIVTFVLCEDEFYKVSFNNEDFYNIEELEIGTEDERMALKKILQEYQTAHPVDKQRGEINTKTPFAEFVKRYLSEIESLGEYKENPSIPSMKYTCKCCGYKTLDSIGEYQICPVCYWEDDPYFNVKMDSGSNNMSLLQGQLNYMRDGYCSSQAAKYVRKAKKDEMIDVNWKPLLDLNNKVWSLCKTKDSKHYNKQLQGDINEKHKLFGLDLIELAKKMITQFFLCIMRRMILPQTI